MQESVVAQLDSLIPETNTSGVVVPLSPVYHRDDEYDSSGFEILQEMQERHFWYAGRHRFLFHAFRRAIPNAAAVRAIDLGGGCGGWIKYVKERVPEGFSELALADSSIRALEAARNAVGVGVSRYQIDLLRLGWRRRWDVAFLLDVLEHITDDERALGQIENALAPGGLLFVTTPALRFFWSYNDELAHHVRRYATADFQRLAAATGFKLVSTRYFMFFLSPLLLLSRWQKPKLAHMTPQETLDLQKRTHRTPPAAVNRLLRFVFDLETPLGQRLRFPWGTSILAVFQKQ